MKSSAVQKYLYIFVASVLVVLLFCYPAFKERLNGEPVVTDNKDYAYVPILMYHQIKNFKNGRDVISQKEFEDDLKFLHDNNYNTVTVSDLLDFVNNSKPLPENPIMLSFDDAYLNTYINAFPLLKKYNMKIVISVIGKATDDFSKIKSTSVDYAHMSWSQINEMIEAGCAEVQNHTYNLHSLDKGRYGSAQKKNEEFFVYKSTLTSDLQKLQDEIQQNCKIVPQAFTYPYGKFNENTVTIIKEMGFKSSLSCDYGINKITKDPNCMYNLKRIGRSHGVAAQKALEQAIKTIH